MDDTLVGVSVRTPARGGAAGHLTVVVYRFSHRALYEGDAQPPTGTLLHPPPPESGVLRPVRHASFRLHSCRTAAAEQQEWAPAVAQWRAFLVDEVARAVQEHAEKRARGAPQLRIVLLTPDPPHTDLSAATLLRRFSSPPPKGGGRDGGEEEEEMSLCSLLQDAAPAVQVSHAHLLLHELGAVDTTSTTAASSAHHGSGEENVAACWLRLASSAAETIHAHPSPATLYEWRARWARCVVAPLSPLDSPAGACRTLCVLWLLTRGSMPVFRDFLAAR